jgi:hypothetical protein
MKLFKRWANKKMQMSNFRVLFYYIFLLYEE